MNKVAMALVLALMAASPSYADKTIQLRVTASVLPRPCDYDKRCYDDDDQGRVPAAQTKALIRNEKVSYVGPRPVVGKKDGLMTVMF